MFSLSIILIIYDPHATQKASVGMYIFNCFCFCYFLLHECNYIIYIKYRWEVLKFARGRKSSSHAPR